MMGSVELSTFEVERRQNSDICPHEILEEERVVLLVLFSLLVATCRHLREKRPVNMPDSGGEHKPIAATSDVLWTAAKMIGQECG
jgi:hypothetical protein